MSMKKETENYDSSNVYCEILLLCVFKVSTLIFFKHQNGALVYLLLATALNIRNERNGIMFQ